MLFYFGYGSNIDLISLKAKGVVPVSSVPAVLYGWRLRFNVQHWFRHEGGVANIEPSANSGDYVEGMLHSCPDESLQTLDLIESYGIGYDRIEVGVRTSAGMVTAQAYIGLPDFLDDSCLPTRRYLNIIIRGAENAGLHSCYIDRLRVHPVFGEIEYPEFEPPKGDWPMFSRESLAAHPGFTALEGSVFDMRNARKNLQGIIPLLEKKDMTLFFVKRHDTSDGSETIDDILQGRISREVKKYLNAYLNEFSKEYIYAGTIVYEKDEDTNTHLIKI